MRFLLVCGLMAMGLSIAIYVHPETGASFPSSMNWLLGTKLSLEPGVGFGLCMGIAVLCLVLLAIKAAGSRPSSSAADARLDALQMLIDSDESVVIEDGIKSLLKAEERIESLERIVGIYDVAPGHGDPLVSLEDEVAKLLKGAARLTALEHFLGIGGDETLEGVIAEMIVKERTADAKQPAALV
ncbi:MAG: hypothetical protein G01um101425_1018 [Candidatus Peregrinibacteria bacterium Gr01-1014_25]|nr:MAG: hypothetical protein G01um101425_1018 [Candidatus Peregrinibacteria bacterium Gr01-1014_25]